MSKSDSITKKIKQMAAKMGLNPDDVEIIDISSPDPHEAEYQTLISNIRQREEQALDQTPNPSHAWMLFGMIIAQVQGFVHQHSECITAREQHTIIGCCIKLLEQRYRDLEITIDWDEQTDHDKESFMQMFRGDHDSTNAKPN